MPFRKLPLSKTHLTFGHGAWGFFFTITLPEMISQHFSIPSFFFLSV
jgi:hypothetical protein